MHRKPAFTWLQYILLALFFIGQSFSVNAQDLKVVEIDSSEYPRVKLSLSYSGTDAFNAGKLQLSENGKQLQCNITDQSKEGKNKPARNILFLIEASGITYGKALNEIKEGLTESFDNLTHTDLINAAAFGGAGSDTLKITLLSDKFSSRHQALKTEIKNSVKAAADTGLRNAFFKGILEGLEYMEQHGSAESKLLVVLSSGRNESKTEISSIDCVTKAQELNIPVYGLTVFPSDTALAPGQMMSRIATRTGGKNYQVRSQLELINALNEIYTLNAAPTSKETMLLLDFEVPAEAGQRVKIELNYNGARKLIAFGSAGKSSLIPEDYKTYLWISIGILAVIVLIMLTVNMLSSRKQKSEFTPETEPEIKTAAQVAPLVERKPAEPVVQVQKKTQAAPAPAKLDENSAPVILVSINGRTQSFPLLKPETTIGRHDVNDITIPELTVTGKHAVIKLEGDQIILVDLGSTNGTFVNGERIRTKAIRHGDKFRLGTVELTLKE